MAKNRQLALFDNPTANRLKNNILSPITNNPDVGLAAGVLLILALLLLPLPPFALDLFLALNIALSVMILMVAVYLVKPLDFSAFPAILLITTMLRLGLNVASTRLILGQAEAGKIIYAFGDFVVGGNIVVGIIIFLILLVINFIVVIKGSTRIAEVSARFTLDAMPGKQMSIDADLNAGYIDEQTAKERRDELAHQADFFGSMDGAAKFIKGDAIAGIIITIVNLIGGFAIGMLQRDMSFAEAIATYSTLTIGDGLVSQIPALLISVAGGLVVTRSGARDQLETEFGQQFGAKPRALFIAAATLFLIGLLPGFPFIPFAILAAIIASIAYFRTKTIKEEAQAEMRGELEAADESEKPSETPVEDLLKVDPVEIELGYSLISLVDEQQGGDVFKRITNVRKQLATELGIILPPVRVRDNLQLDPENYVIKIRGNEVASNFLFPNMLLAMNPGTAEGELRGKQVTEPVFGLPAKWIDQNERENAEIMGYTVVESATVLTTHLTEILKQNSDKLLTRQDTKQLIENLKEDYPALTEEVTPDNIPLSVIQKVLQNLLSENIPIRDLPMILESLIEYYRVTQNLDVLTEYVRHNLSETIKSLYEDEDGVVNTIALSPDIEDKMTQALQNTNGNQVSPTMGMPPQFIEMVKEGVAKAIDDATIAGHLPVVICSAQVRPYFKKMIQTAFPVVSVISYSELPSDTDIEVVSNVNLLEQV
ncbi:MAG: flagellar biosynthesis protein FlhA [Chlorobiota bacterium]